MLKLVAVPSCASTQIVKPASLQRLHHATQRFDRVPIALKMWRPLCQPFPMLSLFICLVHVGFPRLVLFSHLCLH